MHEVFDFAKYLVEFNRFLSYMEVKCQVRLERYSKVFCVFGPGKTCGAKFVLDHLCHFIKVYNYALKSR